MSGIFQTKKLGELCNIVIGRTPSRSQPEYWGKGMKWLSISDIQGKKINFTKEEITHHAFEECGCRLLSKGTLVMSFKLSIGKLGFIMEPMCTNEAIAGLIIKEEGLICKEYLYYVLQAMDLVKGGDRAVKGVTLNKQKLNNLNIAYPSLEEQKKIVAVLDKAQALIEKRKAAIAKLDKLIQAIFIDTFGDPIKNPQNYEIVQLEELISFLTSGSRGWAKYFSKEGELFITIKNVKNGQLQLGDITYVNAPMGKEAERTKVQEGDLLISITADLGRTAVISKEVASKGAYINQHLSLIRLNQKCNPRYLSSYLESAGGKNQFESLNQTGVKSGLNFAAIKSLKIVLPPLEKQNRYDLIFREYLSEKEKMSMSLSMLEANFNSLLQRTFRGEVVINTEVTV
ncbi:restriction endonuclease subunit S [Bacillus cereus]|uniref:restriction endonuclease subunit S n=1 Tax=Bacillus cereus TaxID=1396 RepID=UPI0008FE6934|nr:restriction endonuclease subunit S [Bacillus cereus]OJE10557.1 hypothetical protein A9487_05835 [Bacillus cereus]